uniref:Uncharacterized protein n=1 Tax=Parastrongyloides trichosuri TaxID=131310 RepID=A0A0N4ZRB2_PARTI
MSNTKFSLIRMHFLRNHLKEMINLTTLILDFNMINTLERFNQLCNSLNKDLKNLKMYNCLEMTIDYLLLLSNQCKQIEILSLNNIISETIQLRKVISTFGCLNGLYIDFGNFYNTMDILYALKHDGKDSYSLKWPEMNYLSIICNSLTPHEKILLDKIEKATPRKPGQFLINTISNTKNRNKRLKITIQKSLTYDGEFYKIFHDSFY